MEKKFGIKTSGTTVANNGPVGSAGQPNGRPSKKDSRAGAIERRISKMNKDNGKKGGGY